MNRGILRDYWNMVHFCDLIKFMLGMRHGEILLLNTVDDIIISMGKKAWAEGGMSPTLCTVLTGLKRGRFVTEMIVL